MTDSKVNLVYVFADQLRYSSIGCNGDPLAKTPNLDRLGDECTVMENAVSGHPVCSPYRASLLTGKYTASRSGTGMVINEIRINPKHKTFANVLEENGYETSYIGKWHMYAAQLGNHYDVKNSFIPPGENRLGFNGYFAGYNFHHEYYAPKAYYHLDTDEKIYCKKYEPDEQTDMAIERIKTHKKSGEPFALFLSYGTPHDPWTKENVPKEYYEQFADVSFPLPPNYKEHNDPHADGWAKFLPGKRKQLEEWKRVYYAMVANLDYNIGRIIKALKDEGIYDNTIFVFTTDNEEMFGAQGRHAKNIFYDEAVRVPFFIKWGDKLPKMRNQTCFNTVDIMPTLLGMMKLPIPESVQGNDISGCVLSGTQCENDCLMMGTGPTAIYGNGKEWRAIRTQKYTYALYKSDGEEFLFNNIDDKYQTKNLAEDENYSDILTSLREEMFMKMKALGDYFPQNSYYKKHWVKGRKILPDLK